MGCGRRAGLSLTRHRWGQIPAQNSATLAYRHNKTNPNPNPNPNPRTLMPNPNPNPNPRSAYGAESYSSALGPDLSAEPCNAGIYRHNETNFNPNPTLTLTLTLTRTPYRPNPPPNSTPQISVSGEAQFRAVDGAMPHLVPHW